MYVLSLKVHEDYNYSMYMNPIPCLLGVMMASR